MCILTVLKHLQCFVPLQKMAELKIKNLCQDEPECIMSVIHCLE